MSDKKIMTFDEWRLDKDPHSEGDYILTTHIHEYAEYYHAQQSKPSVDVEGLCKNLSRVEVIGNGREYVNMNTGKVTLSYQDDGRTLKVFVEKSSGNKQLEPSKDVEAAIDSYSDIALNRYNGESTGFVEEIEQAAHFGYSLAKGDAWVSVEDRLPEMNPDNADDVLIVMAKFGARYPYIKLGWYNTETKKWEDEDSQDLNNNPDYFTVTHWQPLPPVHNFLTDKKQP